MGLFTVVRIFTLTIFFNTILPTGDVYSDILLMFQTWTFQNTDSLEMIGCRSCFGKSEKDLYPTMNECKMCLKKMIILIVDDNNRKNQFIKIYSL